MIMYTETLYSIQNQNQGHTTGRVSTLHFTAGYQNTHQLVHCVTAGHQDVHQYIMPYERTLHLIVGHQNLHQLHCILQKDTRTHPSALRL